VVKNWPALLRAIVPPEKNLVQAGAFDGDCLATDDGGKPWRVADAPGSGPAFGIVLDRPADQLDNPALLLTRLDSRPAEKPLHCYQPLAATVNPGAVLALRYRARAKKGTGSLSVYLGMTVLVPDREAGPVADRIRSLRRRLSPEGDRWWYGSPAWVTPGDNWQTYLTIIETPPLPFRVVYRDLGIELTGTGQVWVDDVELFVWQPRERP
jgi:hypothetical protein